MFDGSLPGPAAVAAASNAELIDAIAGWARTAAAAEARKFAALAEWKRRADAGELHSTWACDDIDNAAAQVGCALTVSHGRAIGMMTTAATLRDKLPKLARLFMAGQLSERVIARILWLTRLVVDDTVWAALDEQFAQSAAGWGVLSGDKLDTAITVWIHTHDPDAVRRARERTRQRNFKIGKHDDETGTTSVYGVVHSLDAAVAAARMAAMVASVCDDDPRTLRQLRADAFGAVFAGVFTLACRCANPDCPATGNPDGRAASVVVHVVTDHNALDADPDPAIHGDDPEAYPEGYPDPDPEAYPDPDDEDDPEPDGEEQPQPPAEPEPEPAPDPEAEPEPEAEPQPEQEPESGPDKPAGSAAPPQRRSAAVIAGLRGAVLPAPLLAEVIAAGAKVRVVAGVEDLTTCPGYRPSAALAEFVRARDLTCRVPGCDRPAVFADLDHINPWPAGPTHPGNLGCKCRLHHLMKTFWQGWKEVQLPDGTLQVTTPTGHTYTTKPFSALLFPSWNTTTADPPPAPAPNPPPRTPGRELMMPTRRRTRAQNHAAYITRERHLNARQRELDRAAAQKAAEERRAKRAALLATPRGAQWAARLERIDHLLQPLSHPPEHQPDYGNDPPPF